MELKSLAGDKICIVHMTDLHLMHTSPSNWIYENSYKWLMFNCLERVFRVCNELSADVLVISGDVFHSSAASKNPINFVNEVIRSFNTAGVPIIGIAGNHDQKNGSNENLDDTPLGNIILNGVFHLLDNNPVSISAQDFNVEIYGTSFYHAQADWFKNFRASSDKHRKVILAGHFLFGPSTGVMYRENVYGPDFLGEGDFDAILMGHRHEDQGVTTIDGKIFSAPGGSARTGLYSHDITRVPTISIIEFIREPSGEINTSTSQMRLDFVPPINHIFNLEELQKRKETIADLENFVANLNTAHITHGQNVEHTLSGMGLDETVLARCLQYLQEN